jgi:Tol biopolymer transport system component
MTNLWLGPADDFSKAKQLTFQSFNPSFGNFALDWLPDNKIVYATSIGRGPSLWVMDPDGQNKKEITPPGNGDQVPSASGDGRFVVFASSRSGADEIWRTDIDGANAKQLTTCGKNYSPSASRDGKWVVYVSTCPGLGGLWRISPEGGQPLRLTDRAVLSPWVSPDSKWIACGYKTETSKWQLAIVPIGGGPPAKVFDVAPLANFNGGQRWTPDSKAVTYRDWGQGLWRQAVEGGPPQRIPGVPEEKIYSYDWSRDGKLFAFTRGVEIRDVVLISSSN